MFILRFVGRILSIGFILFIMFVLSGKNAKAEAGWPAELSAPAHLVGAPAAVSGFDVGLA